MEPGQDASGWYKTQILIALASVISLILNFVLKIITTWVIYLNKQGPAIVHGWSRTLQLFSTAVYSSGHVGVDSQGK